MVGEEWLWGWEGVLGFAVGEAEVAAARMEERRAYMSG